MDLRVERLADIEEARLCGKSRRVAFIYELRIERLSSPQRKETKSERCKR